MRNMKKLGNLSGRDAHSMPTSRLGIGLEKLDRAVFEPERTYEKLGGLGIKWVRIQSGWARTERVCNVYNFDWLDDIVDNLISRGMLPWICLCYGNALYDDYAKEIFGAVGCPPIYTDEQKSAWYNYVRAIAAHFKGRVRHFEVWNEPDGQHCWKKGVNATEYGHFVIDTAKALREGNDDAYVIGGSVHSDFSLIFLQRALETGMGNCIDGLTFHEYTYTEQNVFQKVKALRGLCMLHGINPDIIQGESGCQSRPDGHGALSEGAWTPRIQAKLLLRHMTVDLLSGVLFTSYFTCVDMIEALNGEIGDKASYLDYGYFGVLSADFDENGIAVGDYTPKLSYYALRNLNALLGGKLENIDFPVIFHRERIPYLGQIMTTACYEMVYGGFRLDNGSYALAYWRPAELITTEWESAVCLECSVSGKPHLVDPMDGSVYEIDSTAAKTDEYGTTIFRYLPIRDYPLFLVFGELPGGYDKL